MSSSEAEILIFPSPMYFVLHLLLSIKFTTVLFGRHFCMKSFIAQARHFPQHEFLQRQVFILRSLIQCLFIIAHFVLSQNFGGVIKCKFFNRSE